MNPKTFKERVLKEKDQTNIYMQKTQGPKPSMSSPNLNMNQRLKSKTGLEKENYPPNVPVRSSKPVIENSFGAAKQNMRESCENLKYNLTKQIGKNSSTKELPQFMKINHPRFDHLSKSTNFDKCLTQRSVNAFAKKHLKTEEDEQIQSAFPIIEDCQMVRSENQDSYNQDDEEGLNYAKSYQRSFGKQNKGRNVWMHESLNCKDGELKQMGRFEDLEANKLKKFQFSREEQKKMKNEIFNKIIRSSKAEMMKSCDLDQIGTLYCATHNNKRAKYRLDNFLKEGFEEPYFCSKCAVNIAKQGIGIEQISIQDKKMIMSRRTERSNLQTSMQSIGERTKRQEQVMNFQMQLQKLKSKISQKLSLFSEKSYQMTKFDKNIQLTISNYDSLIEILKEMRNQQILNEEKRKKQVNHLLNQKLRDINMKKHELSVMLNNIDDAVYEINFDKNKLMALKTKDYSFIVDSYINKISQYQKYLRNLEQTPFLVELIANEPCYHQEEFDEEEMIHKIFDQMYQRFTDPKLEALKGSCKPPSQSQNNKTEPILETDMESGGSSMFYCQEEWNEEKRPPFRTLFQSNQNENSSSGQENETQSSMNVRNSISDNSNSNINGTKCTVQNLKDQNFYPNVHRYH